MARAMTASAEGVITAEHANVCVFVEMEFPSGFLRFTNAGHGITWNGVRWLGAGALAGLEPITEVASPQAAALNVRFSGIETAYLSAILNDQYQGNPAQIWIAPLGTDMLPVNDPVLVFEGRLDQPIVTIGDTAEIQISLENRFADWDRPRLRMYSDADQKARFPGDRYFEYVASLESVSITWGTYRGPVAPDPLKVINRTVDRFGKSALPAYLNRPVLTAARKVGDTIAKVFGW